jgi:hypothetical protein
MTEPSGNVLYYGDNLDVLKRYVMDESVESGLPRPAVRGT